MFLQQLINGLAQGSLFALIAISFSLVWGLLKMVNFALGEVYMLGAYAGWLVVMHVTPNLAVALDFRTASLMGMKVDKITSLAFSLSGALAGFVGVLAAIYYNAVNPSMGFVAGLKGFTAAVFGGITSIPGAILGGYLLGGIENLSVQFVSSGYRDFVSYLILIIFLLFRPNGILGKKTKL